MQRLFKVIYKGDYFDAIVQSSAVQGHISDSVWEIILKSSVCL